MSRIALNGQSYQGKSIISSGQECVNLYGEYASAPPPGDPQAPVPVTYYPFAGTTFLSNAQFAGKVRCVYRTSRDTAYVVINQNVYFLAANFVLVPVGVIADNQSQIIMSDNGIVVVLVDGPNGWVINMADNQFAQIVDPNFYGADFVAFIDTFLVFNVPRTNQFYLSLGYADFAMFTSGNAFDPLDIAAKTGFSDNIVGIIAVHNELWLIGELTCEVWVGTGAADFYFQRQQGAFIQHGCAAKYSITQQDNLVFFVMQDQQGRGIIVQGEGYQLKEISTPRVVSDIRKYADMTDGIGMCFQVDDHPYYSIVFPTADRGWLYDLKTGLWSEWLWLDSNGNFHRPRANCAAFVYGRNVVGDWENGNILELNPDVFTDYTNTATPISRVKTFPHILGDKFQRISGRTFTADMEPGTTDDLEDDPKVWLSWSDDRGATYGNAIPQSLGRTGQYLTTLSWNRLGQSRDRIYKLQWSSPVRTALNGGFIEGKASLS